MMAPAVLALTAPLFVGLLAGPGAAAGLVAGATVSGLQTALSAQNSGAAWSNAKKELERSAFVCKLALKKANIDEEAARRKAAELLKKWEEKQKAKEAEEAKNAKEAKEKDVEAREERDEEAEGGSESQPASQDDADY